MAELFISKAFTYNRQRTKDISVVQGGCIKRLVFTLSVCKCLIKFVIFLLIFMAVIFWLKSHLELTSGLACLHFAFSLGSLVPVIPKYQLPVLKVL